jgi:hypothetical protein
MWKEWAATQFLAHKTLFDQKFYMPAVVMETDILKL